MTEDARAPSRQILCTKRRQRAGAHVRDNGRVEDGLWLAGPGIEQVKDAELGGQTLLVIVHIVADDLYPSDFERRDVAAQHVEMTVKGGIRFEMDARLDDYLAIPLGDQPGFDGGKNLPV